MMSRRILLSIVFSFFSLVASTQIVLIDSLKQLIDNAKSDSARIFLLNKYAGEISYNNPEEARTIFEDNILRSKEIGYKVGEANALYGMAISFALEGKYESSLNSMIDASKIYQQINHPIGYAKCLGGQGNIYYYMNDYAKAQQYYEEALDIYKRENSTVGMAGCIGNLGLICERNGKLQKALEYQYEGLALEEKMGNTRGIAISHISIASLFINLKNIPKAREHALKSINLSKIIPDSAGIADGYIMLAECYRLIGKFDSALVLIDKSVVIADNSKAIEQYIYALQVKTSILDTSGNYKDAFRTHQKLLVAKDSLFNKEKTAQLVEMQTKYETERKEKENALLTSRNFRQRIILFGLIFVIISIVVLAFQIYNSRRKLKNSHERLLMLHQEVQQQKEEIETQAENLIRANEAIVLQKDQIESTHQKISDSIVYASFIQSAMLPSEDLLQKYAQESFILYKPRDIVSGDFYWFHEKEGSLIIAVADCTGHGVPGALLSMMGISFLNDIATSSDFIKPEVILDKLRHNVKLALGQTTNRSLGKEGIEIGICSINPIEKTITYSGAYLSAWLLRDGEFVEIKGDKMPIGVSLKEKSFTSTVVKYEPNDFIYLFTDGYSDQIGGPNGKKLLRRNILSLLKNISNTNFADQRMKLNQNLDIWRGSKYEQIDDVLVLGIKL